MLCLLERAHAVVVAVFSRRASTLSRSNGDIGQAQVNTARSANGGVLNRSCSAIYEVEARFMEVSEGFG